jgi:ATP-dependent Clp protease ATP-binding subunit ClpC
MQRHTPAAVEQHMGVELPTTEGMPIRPVPPRWATIRRAVEQAVGKRPSTGMYPFENFTPSAQKLLTLAQSEALKGGYSYIGTEHMLLAAFADPQFQSAQVLAALGVQEEAARAQVAKLLGKKKMPVPTKIIPTSRVKLVIELAFKLCGAAGDPKVSTAHLLLALAAEGQGLAAHVLNDLGATKERIEAEMAQLDEPEA